MCISGFVLIYTYAMNERPIGRFSLFTKVRLTCLSNVKILRPLGKVVLLMLWLKSPPKIGKVYREGGSRITAIAQTMQLYNVSVSNGLEIESHIRRLGL